MTETYLVIGSGVFGLTTALSLSAAHPDAAITVVDRFEPPTPDGASVDSSRIVRADYGDPVYAKLAKEAQVYWRTDRELKRAYHETGMLLNTADGVGQRGYLEKCIGNVKSLGIDVREFEGDALLLHVLGHLPEEQKGHGLRGYLNPVSGFADAKMGIEILYGRAKKRANIHFIFGEVSNLMYETADEQQRTRVLGARLRSGRKLLAETTILAAGAWQLPDVPIPSVATGQVLGYLDLTEDEMIRYKDMPIVINFSTGWFCIPPYDGHLKVARHAEGYLNTQPVVGLDGTERNLSVPRTSVTHGNQRVPDEGLAALREGMKTYLPHDLAHRPFSNTRVCWYTDTPLADFLIDWYPEKKGLFVATGGSGHGYKFLPILGDLILSVLDGSAEESLRKKWSFEVALGAAKDGIKGDGSRGRGPPLEWSSVA